MQRFLTRFTIPLIVLFSVWASANLKWGGKHWKYTIISDGKGYYAYLPATFIYHDLNLGFFDTIEATYYDEHVKYDYRSNAYGKSIDKYFCGVAVLQTPFFLAGHLATLISGKPADGYSILYVTFICFGAIFYLTIGLVFLQKFLRMHGASPGQSAFIVALIFFGTNLFYYAIVEPMMSHVYSFALVSIFLVVAKKWTQQGERNDFLRMALLLGLITLVRPVNALIVFWLIVEAGGVRALLLRIKNSVDLKTLFVSLVLFAIPVSLQFFIYYWQTGHFFVDAYGKEGFDFRHPQIGPFLFSYRKGLFVYLPLTLVALAGFYFYWKKDSLRALWSFVFLAIVIYVLSSWWMWYYGGSFGTRVIIEYLPVFALLLFFLLNGIKNKTVRISTIVFLVLIVALCQVQTAQYRYEIIHWSDMTQEKYWDMFLQLKK